MQEFKVRTSHRPRPLPSGRWAMTQRWNDLLFAHWPIPAAALAALLPDGLRSTPSGSAWLGVVPFWLDRIKIRGVPPIPGARSFPELNLRTYVRDQLHRNARRLFFLARRQQPAGRRRGAQSSITCPTTGRRCGSSSARSASLRFTAGRRVRGPPVIFKARYRGLGPTRKLAENRSGTLEYFLTERYCLFTRNRAGQPIRANLHHVPWPLEEAEAEIERNDLAASVGIELPRPGAGAALLAPPGGLYLARGAGATGARRPPGEP